MEKSTQNLLDKLVEYVTSEKTLILDEATVQDAAGDISRVDEIRRVLNLRWKVNDEPEIRSHRRFPGKLIILCKRAIRKSVSWYIKPIKDQQTEFNMLTVQVINEIRNRLLSIEGAQQTAGQAERQGLSVLRREFDSLSDSFLNHYEMLRTTQNDLDDLRAVAQENEKILRDFASEQTATLNAMRVNIDSEREVKDVVAAERQELVRRLGELQALVTSLQDEIEILSSRVWLANNNRDLVLNRDNDAVSAPSNINGTAGFDYVLFESKFRGSQDLIKTRQKRYVSDFDSLDDILDIGCGRGEFISLMVEQGKRVTGIELNEEMYALAKRKGLPVLLGDGIEYLRTVPDHSLGGIFASHVIEHLSFDTLNELVELALSKLRPTGRLVLETPNPTTLLVFAKSFYMDPTHVRPVHPETLQFLLKSKGFATVNLIEMEPAKEQYLPQLYTDPQLITNITEFNEGIVRLNRILYGPQDYAVVATR